MAHTTEIIEYRKLSDCEFAVCIKCCDDHLHWHTMHSSVVNDDGKLSGSLELARGLAAENHEAAIQAEVKIKSMIGAKAQHG